MIRSILVVGHTQPPFHCLQCMPVSRWQMLSSFSIEGNTGNDPNHQESVRELKVLCSEMRLDNAGVSHYAWLVQNKTNLVYDDHRTDYEEHIQKQHCTRNGLSGAVFTTFLISPGPQSGAAMKARQASTRRPAQTTGRRMELRARDAVARLMLQRLRCAQRLLRRGLAIPPQHGRYGCR